MSVIMETLSQVVDGMVGSATSIPSPIEDPVGAVKGVAGVAIAGPMELANAGIALATGAITAVLPSMPAATFGSFYVGAPHGHLHPPSLIPPAPVPVPLPSMGMVTLGTCVQVLIGGKPAARAGDLGIAPTCGGFAPFFTIFMGSSKVFIGGNRAARMTLDMCTACTPQPGCATLRGAASALGAAARLAGKASQAAAIASIADTAVAAAESLENDPALAGAQALAAGMSVAQMAADAAASAMSATMGTDPAVPPFLPGVITSGAPNVLIAGAPIPNLADVANFLFHKLKSPKAKNLLGQLSNLLGGGKGCKK